MTRPARWRWPKPAALEQHRRQARVPASCSCALPARCRRCRTSAMPPPRRSHPNRSRASACATMPRCCTRRISDEFDVSTLLDVDDQLSFRRPGIGSDVTRKLRKGHWSIQRALDLHGLRTDDARAALTAFIRDACQQGIRCVRIVHGKGLGSPGKAPVLKHKVHGWLVQKSRDPGLCAGAAGRRGGGGTGGAVAAHAGCALKATPASVAHKKPLDEGGVCRGPADGGLPPQFSRGCGAAAAGDVPDQAQTGHQQGPGLRLGHRRGRDAELQDVLRLGHDAGVDPALCAQGQRPRC
jgi:DNA-nicking Smr family endonuclease